MLSARIYLKTLWMQGWYNIHRSTNVLYHTNKMKDKNHMIKSIDAQKAFDKIQDPFMIKTLCKTGIEGTYLNVIRPHMTNPQPSSYSMGKNYKCSLPLKIKNKTGMATFATVTQLSTGSPSHSNQTSRRNKRHPNG